MQLIAVLIIGGILLIIIGAFVLSPSFRKDVIASEGEASILGLFNVKGVLIILLTAIFCGTFIYVLREDMPEIVAQTTSKSKASIEWIDLESGGKRIVLDSAVVCEVKPLIGTCRLKKPSELGTENEVDGIPGFCFRIDSARYVSGEDSRYRFDVRFGEKDKQGETIWQNTTKVFYKTADGKIEDNSQFIDVSDSKWKRQYKVMMTLGQPRATMKYIDNVYLIVASSEVDIRR